MIFKVLFVTDILKQRSGVASVMMNYYRNIDSKEVHIDFMTWEGNEPAFESEIKQNGSQIFFMPRLGLTNYFKTKKFFSDFFQLHKGEYQIIHSHFYQMDSIIFPIAKKNGVKACISHSHNTKYSEYFTKIWRNWLLSRGIKKHADYWAACSDLAGTFLFGKKFKESKKSIIINNAIDLSKYAYDVNARNQIRNEYDLEGKFVIGNVGSLKPQKNQKFLIDVFSVLKSMEEFSNSVLLIVGDGALKQELIDYTQKKGLKDDVIFMGSRNDVHKLLSAMDLFVFPSLFEGLGLTLIEAQCSGLRCIASNQVPNEAKISNLISFVPLDNSPLHWATYISQMPNVDRHDYKLTCNEYDINYAAKRLMNFYKSVV